MGRYDAAIIGSGPAGLEAAINLKIRNRSFLFFGSNHLSQKISVAPRVDNYLGLPGISGKDLQRCFADHLQAMEISIQNERVQVIFPMGDFFSIATATETYEATTVILAPGAFSSKPLIGEMEYLGKGVGYCATCDAPLYKGKTVAILGYTEEAAHEANFVAELASKTYYIPMKKQQTLPHSPVEILYGKVSRIVGDQAVHGIQLDEQMLAADGVFILRESLAPASLMPGIALQNGYIQVDVNMATSIAGCFAAGDCTGIPHQYMRAAGQGQTAALHAVAYLDKNK